jgi:hypothetical protein
MKAKMKYIQQQMEKKIGMITDKNVAIIDLGLEDIMKRAEVIAYGLR